MIGPLRPALAVLCALALATLAVIVWPGEDAIAGRRAILFTVWGMPFEDRLFLDRYAAEWERLNPEVRVDYRRFGDDLLMKYNAWHARGHGAEVMRLRITDYHGMAARGMLERLHPSPERLADIPAHIRDLLVADGPRGRGIYGLPQDNAQFGLFYNRAIFDAHNGRFPDERVEYPSEDWTWSDLRRAAAALTRRDERGWITRAGIDFAVWSWPFMAFFAQAGGELWSEDGRTCLINSQAGVEALEFLRALQREDRSFAPSLGDYVAGAGADALFAAGRTAMLLDGSWRVPNFELVAPDLDFAVAPLPRGRVPAVVSGCVLWGISAHARHKEEARRFVGWLTAPAQALEYWDTLRVAPPASLAALRSPDFRRTRGIERADGGWEVPPMPEGMFESRARWLQYANTPHPLTGRPPGFVPTHPFQTELEEEITRMLKAYLSPTSRESAREVLDRAARNVNERAARERAGAARGAG